MSGRKNIKDEHEYNLILEYLIRNRASTGMKGYQKRDFEKKTENMIVENRRVYYQDPVTLLKKQYIGSWEIDRINYVCAEYHNVAHFNANDTHKRLSKSYIATTRDIVREYVNKCTSCTLATTIKQAAPRHIQVNERHERWQMDLIIMTHYKNSNPF